MFKSDRILALDIGASKVVLAEFSAKKGDVPNLLKYGIGRLGILPETDTDTSAFIVTTIREIMRDQNISPAPLFMTVSGQAVFPRYVKLPPVTGDKIYQIVQYEAEQNVPFPIQEVVWDYQLLEDDISGDINVMLVAVKTENVVRLTDCVVAAGLEPEVVDVAPMALYNAVRFNYPDLEECTMVLDIGARSSNLIFIEREKIFSRSIPVAGNAITQELMKEFEIPFNEAEALKATHGFVAFGGVYAGPDSDVADRVSKIIRNVITRLHAEVNRSVNFYRGQQGGSLPSLVLLTGGSSIIPHTDTFFREKLQVQVEYLNPFAKVGVSGSIDADQAEKDVHLLGEVTGLALRRSLSCPVEVNLMPPQLVAKKTFRKRQPFFALAAIGLALIMFCWWAYYIQKSGAYREREKFIVERNSDIEGIQARLNAVAKTKAKLDERLNDLMSLVDRRTQWVEMLQTIQGCLRDGLWLTAIRPMSSDNERVTDIEIVVKGFLDKTDKKEGPSVMEEMKNKLGALELFTTNTVITGQPVPKQHDYAREFTIRVNLKNPIPVKPE